MQNIELRRRGVMAAGTGRWRVVALAFPAVAAVGGCGDSERPTNHPPLLMLQHVTTDEDVPVAIRVLDDASDADGDPLRVVSASASVTGQTVEVVDGAIIKVTPAHDFHGMFTVSYKVTDDITVVNSVATVTVRPVNDPPTATGHAQNVHGKVAVILAGSDPDGDALTFEIVAGPAHGELTGMAPALEYQPATSFVGDDSFTFRVSDGAAASEPATIELHVLPGSPPIAFDQGASAIEDMPRSLTLFGSDPDGDPLAFTVVTQPQHGTLTGTAPNLMYTPDRDFNGSDSLQFSVSDGLTSSNVATVLINVAPVNDAPVATPQTVAATEDTSHAITLDGTDIEGGVLSFQPGQPQHGTLSGTGATRTYTPAANYHGPDSFTFTVSDGAATSAPATVTIDVASVEDAPVAQAVSRSVAEDTATTVTLVGTDADGDALTYAIATPPQHGTLTGDAPGLTYKPANDYSGPDSFTYTVSDGEQTSAPASVTLQVTPVNDAPVATDLSVATDEEAPVALTLQATDVDSTTLTFSILTFPADGTLSGTGANLTYQPALNVNGTRTFTFRVNDGAGGIDDGTVTIQIRPVNDPPKTADDFAFSEPGSSVTFAAVDNDTDIDGDTVTLDSIDAPAHGDVDIVDGKIHYTPDAGFNGVDIFAYTAIDSHGATATGTAHVGVGVFPPGAPTEVIATIAGSITSTDTQRAPAISGDGRVVAFTSKLALVPDDANGVEDIYVFDRGTHLLTRASVATGGGEGNGASFRPHLSADGRYVVFDSAANNLVAGDTNAAFDVFRRDRVTGETIRISVATGGGQASGSSTDAEISDDGNLVVFQSVAFDLIASDANGASDVFVRDLAAGTTARVSVTNAGSEADLGSSEPTISGDGRFVAFTSPSINLVAGDSNNASDIFVRDRVAGTTTRASVSSTGGEANSACSRASLSRDGRFISFRSVATNLVGGTPPPVPVFQIYVRDAQQQTTTMSAQPGAAGNIVWARLSADGRYVTAFAGFVFIRDRFMGTLSTPAGASTWLWPMLSGNGSYLVTLDTSGGGRVLVAPNPL
jgi:hypothetical protein